MKLYNVPRNTFITLDGKLYDFRHVDGMYSLCYDENGNIVHLAAWTEVDLVDTNEISEQTYREMRQ